MAKSVPTEYLRQLLNYNPDTGMLTWRDRPLAYFSTLSQWRRWKTRHLGKPATSRLPAGYLTVAVVYKGARYDLRAHRLIWALAYDQWPVAEIDHINGDRSDNRLANLREATRDENAQNLGIDTPTRGTVFVPKYGKFQAQIYLKGKSVWLGYFVTREEARASYLAAKAELHPFQPIPRGGL